MQATGMRTSRVSLAAVSSVGPRSQLRTRALLALGGRPVHVPGSRPLVHQSQQQQQVPQSRGLVIRQSGNDELRREVQKTGGWISLVLSRAIPLAVWSVIALALYQALGSPQWGDLSSYVQGSTKVLELCLGLAVGFKLVEKADGVLGAILQYK